MGVIVRNYVFPMTFSHKGWRVRMTDETGLFSMKDLKVKVLIDIPADDFARNIATNYAKMADMMRKGNLSYSGILQNRNADYFKTAYDEAYNRYIDVAQQFAGQKGVRTFTLGVNGNLIHRFMGENISAAEKAYKQVIEYIDINLGDAWGEFIKSLK